MLLVLFANKLLEDEAPEEIGRRAEADSPATNRRNSLMPRLEMDVEVSSGGSVSGAEGTLIEQS